jgi:[citrate (pro-3S)-lyase] ligase
MMDIETAVDIFITINRNEKRVTCGGIAGNITVCGISEQIRGERVQ